MDHLTLFGACVCCMVMARIFVCDNADKLRGSLAASKVQLMITWDICMCRKHVHPGLPAPGRDNKERLLQQPKQGRDKLVCSVCLWQALAIRKDDCYLRAAEDTLSKPYQQHSSGLVCPGCTHATNLLCATIMTATPHYMLLIRICVQPI